MTAVQRRRTIANLLRKNAAATSVFCELVLAEYRRQQAQKKVSA